MVKEEFPQGAFICFAGEGGARPNPGHAPAARVARLPPLARVGPAPPVWSPAVEALKKCHESPSLCGLCTAGRSELQFWQRWSARPSLSFSSHTA